jgi:hypothetical protein
MSRYRVYIVVSQLWGHCILMLRARLGKVCTHSQKSWDLCSESPTTGITQNRCTCPGCGFHSLERRKKSVHERENTSLHIFCSQKRVLASFFSPCVVEYYIQALFPSLGHVILPQIDRKLYFFSSWRYKEHFSNLFNVTSMYKIVLDAKGKREIPSRHSS